MGGKKNQTKSTVNVSQLAFRSSSDSKMVPFNGRGKRTTPAKGSGSKGRQLLEMKKQYTIKHTGIGRKREQVST